MTPLKDALEVGDAPASEGANRPKQDSGQLRSDAVSLDVPVKVHGSRVVEVVRGTTPHTEPFEEQSSTMIVFPLGGVLKMTTLVSVGQAIVLTNLKTRQDAICRVVKIRTNPNLHSYVEVEFSHPQPGYWGVRFPSDGPEPPKKAAPPAASVTLPSSISMPAPKIEIPKLEIKEQKAPVASSIVPPAPPKSQAPVEAEKIVTPIKPILDAKPEPVAPADSASFSLDQLRGDSASASVTPFSSSTRVDPPAPQDAPSHTMAVSFATEEPASTFGRFAASGEQLAARPAFGASFEYSKSTPAAEKSESQAQGKSWMSIAAVVLLIAAAVGGGFYFLHMRPATSHLLASTTPAAPPSPLAAAPAPSSVPVTSAPVQSTRVPAPTLASGAAPGVAAANSASAPPSVLTRPQQVASTRIEKSAPVRAAEAPNQTARPESTKQNSAAAVPDMFGALNAHPTAGVHTGSTESSAAPSIEAGTLAGQSVALPSNEPSPTSLAPPPPPPQAVPEGPVPVGDGVPAPKAVSSPPVLYPEIARQAGVEGDVVVRIVIDKAGNVTTAKALSGPMMLRDAAARSLRERKYAPSKLNGHPISVEMLVTIQFRR
jgi:TonB family protein